jgi:hypothetical protein
VVAEKGGRDTLVQYIDCVEGHFRGLVVVVSFRVGGWRRVR